MVSTEAIRAAVHSFCTACQQWDAQMLGKYRKCNCGKPDNSNEPSQSYVRAYRENLINGASNGIERL